MRVLITTDSFPPGCGGSGWSTYELARGLRSNGHQVALFHVRAGRRGSAERTYDDFAVQEHAVPSPALPFVRNYVKNELSYRRLVEPLRHAIRAAQADVVHAQHVLTAPPSVAAARLERVPVVCTIRDYWPLCYWSDLIHDPASPTLCPGCSTAMMRRCIRPRAGAAWPLALPMVPYMRGNLERKRRALARADAVIAVSSALAADLYARAPELRGARLLTIPNPVDLDVVSCAARTTHPLDGRPYAIYVGKLARNKGIASLVPAIADANLRWPLIVVGDGQERTLVEKAAAAAGRDVTLLGWLPRDEALAWLAHASLVVFPSYGPESLSRVLLEASLLGRPIAAMDTGGTRDIVVDGESGLLSATAEGLARSIERLVTDRALAEALGRRAAVLVSERFGAPTVVRRVVEVYRDLIERSGRAEGADG